VGPCAVTGERAVAVAVTGRWMARTRTKGGVPSGGEGGERSAAKRGGIFPSVNLVS